MVSRKEFERLKSTVIQMEKDFQCMKYGHRWSIQEPPMVWDCCIQKVCVRCGMVENDEITVEKANALRTIGLVDKTTLKIMSSTLKGDENGKESEAGR